MPNSTSAHNLKLCTFVIPDTLLHTSKSSINLIGQKLRITMLVKLTQEMERTWLDKGQKNGILKTGQDKTCVSPDSLRKGTWRFVNGY